MDDGLTVDDRPERNTPGPDVSGPEQRTVPAFCAGLVRTARPRQWVKNLLVVAAPAAAGKLVSWDAVLELAVVFTLFTAAASAIYFINDACDAESDRAHPDKCRRPVASGQVPVPVAYAVGSLLAVLAPVTAALLCNAATSGLITAYVLMQLAYCFALKHALVIDLVVVTAGFVMRAMCGGLALEIPLSRWFLITAGFGALFLVSAKRYSEVLLMGEGAGDTRSLLREYTAGYLRFVWQLAAGVAVLAYCLWAMEGPPHQGLLPWQQLSMIPFVLVLLRYSVFADRGAAGSPEDVLLHDRPMGIAALSWMLLYGMSIGGL